MQAHGTTEPAAYDFYLQGRGYLQDYVKLEKCRRMPSKFFNYALKKDPGLLPLRMRGLGEAYWPQISG